MLNHTATTAKPEIADSATNTVSGATTLENSASTPPSILTDRAVTGTPRLLTLAKQAGSVFRSTATTASARKRTGRS